MTTVYRRCCGIDVHKRSLSVCVLPPVGVKGTVREERFRTFTRDLKRLKKWLLNCRVTEVVMESTGQYWRPVWNILEESIPRLMLVNPAHAKAMAGRKTDRLDALWLATRLERGDLRGSFIPPREVRELRELTRLRVHWLQDTNRVKNRISQLCEAGNIKVSSVASDLFGQSGTRMLIALAGGQQDAGWMADYARGTLRNKKDQLEMALQGTFTEHRRDLLRRMLVQLANLEHETDALTEKIRHRMASHEREVQLLCGIPGIDRIAAWTILAETGFDMSVFDDAQHLASWAAVCPGSRESGGKRMSGKTRKGNIYLRRILCQCALAATRKKGSHLAALYYRIRSRRGHAKAVMAVAHQLLVIIYHILRDGTEYVEIGEQLSEQQRANKAEWLVRKLHALGYQVDVRAVEAPSVSEVARTEPAPELPSEPVPGRRGPGRPCKCAERGIACRHKTRVGREIRSETGRKSEGPDLQISDIQGDPPAGFS